MESQFANLRHRDNSVAMLRVKMFRRSSQTLKENRERLLDARRPLADLQELSCLGDDSVVTNLSAMKDKTNIKEKPAKSKASEEKLKQLARWKERKALEKEKKIREQKKVFRTGLYHHKDTIFPLPPLPEASAAKTVPMQSSRVTRSMKQQQPLQKPLKTQTLNTAAKKDPPTMRQTRGATIKPSSAVAKPKICAVTPIVSTRSANKPVAAAPAVKKPTDNKSPADEPVEKPSSFAPEGFVFQAPEGLKAFEFVPLTPRSADRFLSPKFTAASFNFLPAAEDTDAIPAEPSESSPLKSTPIEAPPIPSSPVESKHDVPYFRSEMANETNRLTALCAQWDTKVHDESIPEEMRGRIRTTVGQARLLMKERFNQFSGLVDDCELHRGEKITTCSDLQGFWDMVYFQVEDVNKKFESLQEAEGRNWVEEHKPTPRQRKTVKRKPTTAPAKPAATKAAAKSRLAEVKAAMRAQKAAAEAEKAAKAAGDIVEEPNPATQGDQCQPDTVVFDGGFFHVESPAKTPKTQQVCVRRSNRLSTAAPPQASPLMCNHTPRRVTRRSLALGATGGTPVQSNLTLTPLARANNQTLRCSESPLPVTPRPSKIENTSDSNQLGKALTAQSEHMTSPEEVLHTVTTAPSPLTVQLPQGQTVEAALLLFTPNPKDRIRPSVCPTDLMYFTPPL
nr:disks large-associated protein 5-like [Nerophis lumbriciformis]